MSPLYTHIPEADIAAFIAKYGKPYDPKTDDYRRPPFAAPVKAGKNSPIHKIHSYHTKVPPEGIVPYIKHYPDPSHIVLDPFCGSGMTGVACLMTGRHAILSDLSPAATHIAYNYCTPMDVEALKREFERIKVAVKEEFDWLYGTICDRCGGPATIQYTIWSDVFECGRCGSEIVLWNVAMDHDTREVQQHFACPTCGKEQTKVGLRRRPSIPVVTNYECPNCSPHRSEHPTTDSEKERLHEIEAKQIPYWVPSTEFDTRGPQYRRNALASRGIKRVTDLYTKRNLRAFARLWYEARKVQSLRVALALLFALTAINNYINRKQSYGGGGGGLSGSIYIPSFLMEKHLGLVVERKVDNLVEYLHIPAITECIVTTESATNQTSIKDDCIDYIFTDPPFGSNLYYSEVNLLWEAWLENLTDQTLEAVVHRKRDGGTKHLADYAHLMTDSFREMYRVLKPGRWASVVFHNSDDRIWQTILDAAEAAGFELAEINTFDKVQLSFKGVRGQKGLERVTNKDIVLNLHKPKPHQPRTVNGMARREDVEARVVQRVADFLTANPPPDQRTLQHICNHVLYDMIANGAVQVSMADVDRMLPHYFKQAAGRWYLRGEAVVGGRVFGIRDETDAIAWLTAVLNSEPQTTGELIPKWQQATYQISS